MNEQNFANSDDSLGQPWSWGQGAKTEQVGNLVGISTSDGI